MFSRIFKSAQNKSNNVMFTINAAYANSAANPKAKVCIVGSGPAGFYTAQHLIKNNSSLEVDMYEKLPVPFGLVRYGVAPDHADVKNVINQFTSLAKCGRLHFMGNIAIGQDISFSDLRSAYDVVVLAYGAAQDRWLGIPGENLKNVIPARKFVGWYNGLPDENSLQLNLDVETAVIIGQGNVALDIARILLTPIDILKKTDIAQHALEALSRSRVKNVKIVGRRGPLQVAFTIKELREMINLPSCSHQIHIADKGEIEKALSKIGRPRKRLTELLLQHAGSHNKNMSLEDGKSWDLVFNRTPLEIVAGSTDASVAGLTVGVNRLTGNSLENPQIEETGVRETIPCGIVLKSIGYKSLPLAEELPFDQSRGVIRQKEGRVEGMPGVFCSGWVASGSLGVIASTLQSGHDVGRKIVEDLKRGLCESEGNSKKGRDSIIPILARKGVEPVSFIQWETLDREERERGKQLQKPREKIVDVNEMLHIVKQEQS